MNGKNLKNISRAIDMLEYYLNRQTQSSNLVKKKMKLVMFMLD